jgi:Arc/MetJ-type ribon-helix-helix transcriptional regulator
MIESYRNIREAFMRTTKAISITLPEPMLEAAKKQAKKENRTMSEYIREALRQYDMEARRQALLEYGRQSAERIGVKTEADVARVIREFRTENRQRKQAAGTKVRRKAS